MQTVYAQEKKTETEAMLDEIVHHYLHTLVRKINNYGVKLFRLTFKPNKHEGYTDVCIHCFHKST